MRRCQGDDILGHFDRPTCGRHTDKTHGHDIYRASIASCGKNTRSSRCPNPWRR